MSNNIGFDRDEMQFYPLSERINKVNIACESIDPLQATVDVDDTVANRIKIIAKEIRKAKKNGSSVVCAFGAHTIKNGLGRVLGQLSKEGWITHLATNGAGVIHDWEFAYQGKSSEDVRANVQLGRFGTWDETGTYLNLALAVGAYENLGYGESIGSMITHQGLNIPTEEEMLESLSCLSTCPPENLKDLSHKASAAATLLELVRTYEIPSGFLSINHTHSQYSVQAQAFEIGIPFTSHPMFGHDIIYTHSMNRGAAIGITAERDFLSFVRSIGNLEGGVYLSVGSAVMSPMIFEKALSMARNVEQQKNRDIRNCSIHVVDLQQETWNWDDGEPPADNPAYYLRFMKTFNRMGCPVDYSSADNRMFLVGLLQELQRGNG